MTLIKLFYRSQPHTNNPEGRLNMKRFLSLGLSFVFAFSILTACTDKGGGDNAPAGGAPAAEQSGGKDEAGIKTPEVTVNPGDLVFENDIIRLVYNGVEVDDPSLNFPQMSIVCQVGRITEKKIDIHKIESLIINGIDSGITDAGITQLVASKGGDLYVFISMVNLDEKGIDINDIKTVQVTFTVMDFAANPYKDKPLFEGTALFNIVLP